MLSDTCLALLLDGPMQSWGHASRFERRATALHPTRSGVLGLVAAAMGINKLTPDETDQLARFIVLRITTIKLDKRDRRGCELPIQRLEDYHTVTGIRRASGKVDEAATVQTYRHYLLDARFGVLLEGSMDLLKEIAVALQNPYWGIWLGRKCCLPSCPVLAAPPGERATVWRQLLVRAGYRGEEPEEHFDRVVEVSATDSGADMIEDTPVGFGKPIGERHAPRWIRCVPKSRVNNPEQ